MALLRSAGACFNAVAFQPGSGDLVAAAAADPVVRVFRVSTGAVARALQGHTGAGTCLAYQPTHGRLLASGSTDGTLRVWSTRDGRCVRKLGERVKAKIWCCAFDASGELLASGGAEKAVRVWRVSDGTLLSTFREHRGVVRAVAFNPAVPGMVASGEGNLTWGSDNSVRVWTFDSAAASRLEAAGVDSGLLDGRAVPASCRAIVLAHSKMVTALAFPPDGSVLLSASRDCSVRVWGVAPGAGALARRAGTGLEAGDLEESLAVKGGMRPPAGAELEMQDPWVSAEDGEAAEGGGAAAADLFAPEPGAGRGDADVAGRAGKASGVAARLSGQLQVITSKAASGLGLAMPERLSTLWKGSLFSESELEKIRQKREEGMTPDEKAQSLYWDMYRRRQAEAAGAFSEATKDLSGELEEAAQPAGSTPEEISAQLHRLIEHVDTPDEESERAAAAEEVGTQDDAEGEEEEVSEELRELEKMLAEQRKERAAMAERLRSEQQVMRKLKEDVASSEQAGGARGEDLRGLIKAATFAGYRMAELKFERDSRLAGDDLAALTRQRARFEKFASNRRAELRRQAQVAPAPRLGRTCAARAESWPRRSPRRRLRAC